MQMIVDAESDTNGSLASEVIPSNPCSRFVREVASVDDGYDSMECIPAGRLETRRIGAADFLIPTFEHARLATNLLASAIASANERNPNSEEFRAKAIAAGRYINQVSDRHGHALEGAPITIDNAEPRGHFVTIPEGMGQTALCKALQRVLGKERENFEVAVPQGGVVRFTRLPSLTVPFPQNGSPRSFGKLFLRYFDDAMNRAYSARHRGPFHRGEEEVGPALQAYAIAANIGVLIVEGINTRNASAKSATLLWALLARFTADTGIPVVCLATPGAAAALSEQSTAATFLAGKTWYNIAPPDPASDQWTLICEYLYSTYLAHCLLIDKPHWFADAMWRVTRGHTELAIKACVHIESVSADENFSTPGEDGFVKLAKEALVVEEPHLRAITKLHLGGSFTVASLRRHGDWLPVEPMMQTVLGLEETNVAFRITDVRTTGNIDA